MKELQAHVELLHQENDQLQPHIEKSHDLGKDVPDNDQAVRLIARNRGKEPIVPNDVDTQQMMSCLREVLHL